MIRKIQTQEDRDRRAKRNKIIISLLIVFLLGLSSLGYAIMSQEDSTQANTVTYGGLKFTNSNGLWTTTINQKQFYFTYLPAELENVSISGNYSLESYYQKPVYIVNINPALNSLMYILQDISLRMQEACLSGESCTKVDLPNKTCQDNIIIFSEKNMNKTSIVKVDNCVFIYGNFYEGADKMVYKLLNIN